MATDKKNTARLNDDWQYLDESPDPEHPTTDQKFNIHYKTSGMQSVSNIKIEKRKETKEAANDPTFNISVTTIERDSAVAVKKKKEEIEKIGSLLTKKGAKDRMKAVKASWSIASWYLWTVWPVQLIFGIISLAAFGTLAAGSEAASGNMFVKGAIVAVDAISEFVTGTSLSEGVEGLFYIFYVLILAIALFSVFTAFLIYKSRWLKPLSGSHAGFKLSSVLLVFIGYSIPILNLFPWMIVWMLVVTKYPK